MPEPYADVCATARPSLRLTGQVGRVGEDPSSPNLLLTATAGGTLPALAGEGLLGGGVKLAYLDPPYRTGQRFAAYDDHGTSAAWVAMMRQVLAEVRDALSEDGSVWVQVDDHESHHVRLLMDELYGPDAFVADITWRRKRKPSFLHGQIAHTTDHILVAAKNRAVLGPFTTGEPVAARRTPLHHAGNVEAVLRFPAGSVQMPAGPDRLIPAGDMSTPSVATKLLHDVQVVAGRNADPLVMSGPWRWTQERLDRELAAGVLVRAPRLPLRPQAITGSGARTWTTLWTDGVGTNEDAAEHARALFGAVPFDTPKPEELLERIISTASAPGDLVVDLFAGSGTTAAVAHKTGRRWITCEKAADVVDRFTRPRLQKVVDGSDRGGVSVRAQVATGFPLPDGWSARDARRAGQWVAQLAEAGTLDFLDPAARAAVVRAVRDEATTLSRVDAWLGGGGFLVGEVAP